MSLVLSMQNKNNNRFEDIPSYFHGEIKIGGDELPTKIKEDPDFKSVERIYSLREKVSQASQISTETDAWKKVQKRIGRRAERFVLHRFLFSKYAAIVLALVTLSGVLGTLFYYSPLRSIQQTEVRFVAPDGKISALTLSDGTRVWLSPESILEYSDDFGIDNRTVKLEGEALFDVTKNSKLPFITKTGSSEIKVHGTRYLAKNDLNNKRKEVILLEGKVEYRKDNHSIFITGGERITDNRLTGQIAVEQIDVLNYEGWINGKIDFDNEMLEDLTICLSRWYGVTLEFADESIKFYKFTGTISKDKPLDYTLKIIALTNKVKFKKEGNKIIIMN